jgi:hypothetical protein
MKKPRVLVTGGRSFVEPDLIRSALNIVSLRIGPFILVHGAARGADQMADEIASDLGFDRVGCPANRRRDGAEAGTVRNTFMLREMDPDICLAFPARNSKGTWDMARKAAANGVRTFVIRSKSDLDAMETTL